MENLTLNLKVFHIDDGEDFWIIAESEQQARDYYEKSGECIGPEDAGEYDIEEVQKDEEAELDIREDLNLLSIMNEYKPVPERRHSLGIYTYAKYMVLEQEIRGGEVIVPQLIASSVY